MLTPSLGLALALTTAAPEPTTSTGDPVLPVGDVPVRSPPYGFSLSEVSTSDERGTYRLTAQEWDELVEDDPRLSQLHGRAKLRTAGIVLVAVGGLHLAVSTALALDGYAADTATGALFQWGVPAVVIATGTLFTVIGVRARRELHAERQRLYIAPVASRRSVGATATVRF